MRRRRGFHIRPAQRFGSQPHRIVDTFYITNLSTPTETPMKVFISWSGTRSRAVANALHPWLPDVLQQMEPWMSQRDIGAGARWSQELDEQLESTQFGIICVTPENA